ncbi:MAG: efflux transporter periplasmic adaptor subunit [Verrucomicrobia bacterium]|nr:efflux transporter periplasmic adaptor subunit [Verrucomicrobiota bacterium]
MRRASLPRFLPFAGLLAVALLASCSRSGTKAGTAKGDESRIAVTAVAVSAHEMNRYLEGIGSVQALNTVVVRPQVDGKLIKLMFRDGQDVHRGDVLAQIDPRPVQSVLDQALAKRDQDQAQVDFAQKVLDRDLQLKALVDEQTLDQHRAALMQLKALASADEAAVNNARVQLEFTTITAPMDGRAGFRLVNEGNILSASDTTGIVVIKQVQPISVVFTVPDRSFAVLSSAVLARAPQQPLAAFACDRDNKAVLASGTLDSIDNQIDQVSGTIRLKATFPNQPQALWPGQFVNVKLLLSHSDAHLAIPAAAIQRNDAASFVYVVSADSRAVVRPVTVSLVENDLAFIEKGLVLGEKVIVDGQYLLQPNAPVQVKTAPAPSPATR